MKIDRDFYSIGEALQLVADELAPIPSGPLTKLTSRDPGLTVWPPSVEEFANRAVRDKAFIRLQALIAADDIRPIDWLGTYPLQWGVFSSPDEVAHYRINAVDFGKLCAAMPVSVAAEDDVQPVSASAGSATPVLRSETGEDRKRVMLEMRETGLSDEEIGVQFGVTRQRVSQLIDTKAAARAAPKKPSK
ncbi:MAG: hypothetical protein Q8R33_15570 [Burkholderiales bacterium]|nr:hypothetical protein [Burkholderiales bacterium]